MALDPVLSAAGAGIGFLVGLTGMGGGALMTPLLVLVFGVPAVSAVSSDLVTSLVMKPVGAVVHLQRGSVDWPLVRRLCLGGVPAAFAGVLLQRAIGGGPRLQEHLKVLLAGVLLLSLAAMLAGPLLRRRVSEASTPAVGWRTVAVGALGGLCVGTTSVGAGSVVLALLLATHPRLAPSRLVGTDLVQAIPLVAAATVGHLLFGAVSVPLTASLVLGALPGAYLGARVSAGAPARLLRPAVGTLVLASALALIGTPAGVVLLIAVTLGLVWTGHTVARPLLLCRRASASARAPSGEESPPCGDRRVDRRAA